MSGTQDQMNPQEVIFERVYLPTFIAKCASHGLELPDGESIQTALESVAMLKASEQNETHSLTKSAHEALRSSLNIPSPEDGDAMERLNYEKQAHQDALLSDPTLRAALEAVVKAKA